LESDGRRVKSRIRIEYVPVAALKEWDQNPRLISNEQYRLLAQNVSRYGIVDPLIVDQRNRIVGGHQRLKVLKDLRVKTVPIVRLQLTKQDFKVLNLALNKISGEWDKEKLAPLLEELAPLPELDMTGFSKQEANLLIEEFRVDASDAEDRTPLIPKDAKTKPGDLHRLGDHRLLCGDCTDPASWRILMNGEKAGVVITDPPYGVNYDLGSKFVLNPVSERVEHHKSWGAMEQDQSTEAALAALPLIFENLTEDGVVYVCCGTKLLLGIGNWLDSNQIRYAPFLVWDKGFAVVSWERYHAEHEFIVYCGPGSYPTQGSEKIRSRWFGPNNETTVWRIPIESNSFREHPTQKPVALYERAIVNSSVRGEIVVDPFLGSGTCLVAAEKHGRRAYCMEIDPRYVDVAVQRWENYSGKKAERITTPIIDLREDSSVEAEG
jgi:DNA modification methylase